MRGSTPVGTRAVGLVLDPVAAAPGLPSAR